MPSRRVAFALLGAAVSAVLQAGCRDAPTTAPERIRAESITAAGVLARIAAIADDSTRGRSTPSPELDKVAAYAAREFRAFGLRPGFTSGFMQTYPIGTPPAYGPNAAAILDGGDPGLRGEYVLFVAHMDHLGVSAPSGGDSIYNGADDNASGTAAVLELARAFSGLVPRPRRSLIFLLVSGEEEGLLGSQYYAAHPAVPLAQTVAATNFDMIGRGSRDSVLVIGMDLSSLGGTTAAVGLAHPELGMRPARVVGLWGGSDHVPFARSGVPVLFFFSGLHADYQRPSDALDRIDAEKEARIVRLAFYVGLAVADQTPRPSWNPGAWPLAAPFRGPIR